jgi:hypothetical protein
VTILARFCQKIISHAPIILHKPPLMHLYNLNLWLLCKFEGNVHKWYKLCSFLLIVVIAFVVDDVFNTINP